jgi:hypothetical protein
MPLRKIKNPKSFDLCRTCSHYYLSHTDIEHKPSFCHTTVDRCKCQEYVPKENLEYLEWKYERKLAIESGNKSS